MLVKKVFHQKNKPNIANLHSKNLKITLLCTKKTNDPKMHFLHMAIKNDEFSIGFSQRFRNKHEFHFLHI